MSEIRVDPTTYRAAERMARHHRAELVLGQVTPRWLGAGDRFWYRTQTADGQRTFLVDPAAGTREPVDQETLATLAGAPATGPLEVLSPNGELAVFRRGPDLWARSLVEDREWPLTTDGAPGYDYGTGPEGMNYRVLLTKLGLPHLPPAVAWSPDGTRVLTHRTDQRGVRETHLVDALPVDGGAPDVLVQRYPYPGDEHVPHAELLVLDVATGTRVPATTDPLPMPLFSPLLVRWAWWAADGSAVYYLSQPRDQHTLRLHRLDPATGAVTTVLAETGQTRVEPGQFMGRAPMVRVLRGGAEVLWYSQRDGWGHLYRYDGHTGALVNQVTSGAWAVREILHVDEDRGLVYFLASGLVAADPYRQTVCRVRLDGTGFALVTEDDQDHSVVVAPNGRYFVDRASTTDTPPVSTVCSWDGRVLVELEQADISRLCAAGWTAPQRFSALAADGETEIWGVLHLPHDFDPARSYPVIDTPYPGPQTNRVSASFDQGHFGYLAESLAALGFVVFAVDGRGTPGRSKAFHDASYGRVADAGGLADHVAALRQLAATRPWLDLDRVGAVGHSGGGFATVRAMLDFPEFYRVGVALAGSHDNRYYHLGAIEAYEGADDPDRWGRSSNVDSADRLAGKLLLIHGGLDDNVHPEQTLRLAERLIALDKDFELFLVPGAEHLFTGYEHQVNRRTWNFLVRHLMGAQPPADYRLAPIPGFDLSVFAEAFG